MLNFFIEDHNRREYEWRNSVSGILFSKIASASHSIAAPKQIRISSATSDQILIDDGTRFGRINSLFESISMIYGLPIIIDDDVPYGEAVVE